MKYVLLIGLLNMAFGLVLAIYLRRSPNVDLFMPRIRLPERFENALIGVFGSAMLEAPVVVEAPPEEVIDGETPPAADKALPTLAAVPEGDIRKILGHGNLNDKTLRGMIDRLADASEKHRGKVLEIEKQLGAIDASAAQEAMVKLVADFQTLNNDWVARLSAILEKLHDALPNFQDRRELARELEDELLEKTSQFAAICRLNLQIDCAQDRTSRHYLLSDICSVAALTYSFRDQVLRWKLKDAARVAAANAAKPDKKAKPDSTETDGTTNTHSPEPANDGDAQDTATEAEATTANPTPASSTAAAEELPLGDHAQLMDFSGFEKHVAALASRGVKATKMVRVAMLDLDRFSFINSRHGVLNGNEILTEFGRLLLEYAGFEHEPIYVAALTGQTFAVTFPNHNVTEATEVLERLRQSFEASTFAWTDSDRTVTISSGLVEISPHATFEEILSHAHSTMRAAKQAGRNRIAVETTESLRIAKPTKLPIQAKVVNLNPALVSSPLAQGLPDPSSPAEGKSEALVPPVAEPAVQSAG